MVAPLLNIYIVIHSRFTLLSIQGLDHTKYQTMKNKTVNDGNSMKHKIRLKIV